MMNFNARRKGFIKLNLDEELTIENAELENKDFSNRKLRFFSSVKSRFKNCKFENMKVETLCFGAGGSTTYYINCSFDGSTFSAMVVGKARFENCTFQNVNIKQFFAQNAEFINCKFSGKLKKAVFYGRLLEDRRASLGRDFNEINGNDFSELDMEDIDFRNGVDLSKQKLPMGSGYLYVSNAREFLINLEKEILNLSNPTLKKDAEIMLQIEQQKFSEGQKQLFFIKKDIEPRLFDLLMQLANKHRKD